MFRYFTGFRGFDLVSINLLIFASELIPYTYNLTIMDASVFIRSLNAVEYAALGKKTFTVLPRTDEFISAKHDGSKRYFQVIAVHHSTEKEGGVELYAVQTEPPWETRKGRAIGFGPSAK